MKRFLHAFAMFACMCIPWGIYAQSDFSTDYTGNVTLTTNGGTSASLCKVKISDVEYDGIKAGVTKTAGVMLITLPANTKYLHLHVAGWKGENVTLSVTPNTYSEDIALTSDDGISNSSPFTFAGNPSTNDFYKVITFTDALTEETTLTFTATKGKRFVVWGVTAETNTPPTATYFPENNATGVALNVQPTFTFDKAVQKADGTELTAADLVAPRLTFKDAGDNDVAFTATIDDAKKVISVVPDAELAGSTTYTLTLAALQGANGVEQTAANTFSFTTRNPNAPSIDNIAADKSRYFWGETAVLTWNANHITPGTQGKIIVYNTDTVAGEVPLINEASLVTQNWITVDENRAIIPLNDFALGFLGKNLMDDVPYSTKYQLQVVCGEAASEKTPYITIIPAPAIETIRENLKAFNGDSLLTTGVVTAVNGTDYAIQGVGNQNSGMYVYRAKAQEPAVAVGDSVAVLGKLKMHNRVWEIDQNAVVNIINSGKALPAPVVRTMEELLAPVDSVYQGMLVEMSDVVSIKKIVLGNYKDNQDSLISGERAMIAYNTFWGALKSNLDANVQYRVRGILSNYKGAPQICPRNAFDIAPAIAPVPEFAPANDADKVPLNTRITITFDRPMRKVGGAELTNADLASLIAFKDAAEDTAVLFAATICASKDTIYIKPSVSLNGPIEYAVTLQLLEDYFGQAMATTTSSFTTLNPNSPHVDNATIAAATRYLWGEDIVVNFDAKHYTSPTEGYAVLLRDGVRVDSLVIADITANTDTFALGSGAPADGDTYSTNYTIRVGSGADASATTAPFCVIATPTIQHLRQNFATYTDGDTVAVVGVVTGVGTWNTKYKNCKVTIQDGTEPNSGFYLYSATDSLLVIGDSIRAICKVTDFHTLHESDGAVKVEKLGTGNVPAPIELTISEASENKYQSMLVKIKNAKASETSSGWFIDDNTASMQVFGTFYQDFASNFTNGKTYDVIGAMGYYYNTKSNEGAAQIYPRMSSDIMEVTSTPSTPATPSAVAANTLSVKAYPNPFGNEIRVEGVDVRRVEIYNVVGQLVMQTNAVHDGVVSTANLRTGIYLVRFVDANGRAAVLKMSKR